jgi:hypothetical protein
MKYFYLAICLPLFAGLWACKVTPLESSARTLNRDLDLVKSPFQYKVSEDGQSLVRVTRKMPVAETVADPVLRADVEKAIAAKLGAAPKIKEIRIFETQANFRREIWIAEHQGHQLAFDVNLQATPSGGASFRIEGPVEIQGSL